MKLAVSRTSLGVVALQNTSTPSEASICDATDIMRRSGLPILCMRVLTLSNGIDAYLPTVQPRAYQNV